MSFLKNIVAGTSLLVMAACTTTNSAKLESGERPDLRSTEAGLWYQMDKYEQQIATSALVEEDVELNRYVRGVLCKITGPYCNDLRLYIINQPHFNATMAPNGSMYVWTGLLLRMQSEDQLATVLGHEFAHYQHRHSLQKFEAAKATAEFISFFSLATAGVGGGFIGLAAAVGGVGAIQSYSRELEHEADGEGAKLIISKGYNPWEAVKIWENVQAEQKAAEDDDQEADEDAMRPANGGGSYFWASHPPTEDRIKALTKEAESSGFNISKSNTENSRFKNIHAKWKVKWLEEMLVVTPLKPSLLVLDNQLETNLSPGLHAYYKGEAYRKEGSEESLAFALLEYKKAREAGNVPVDVTKKMGIVARRQGKSEQSIQYFQAYLTENSNAKDYSQIQSYLKRLMVKK